MKYLCCNSTIFYQQDKEAEMKRFIEITVDYDGMKMLIPKSGIKTVTKRADGTALIEFESICSTDKPKDRISLIDTEESYEEVLEKLNKAGAEE